MLFKDVKLTKTTMTDDAGKLTERQLALCYANAALIPQKKGKKE